MSRVRNRKFKAANSGNKHFNGWYSSKLVLFFNFYIIIVIIINNNDALSKCLLKDLHEKKRNSLSSSVVQWVVRSVPHGGPI